MDRKLYINTLTTTHEYTIQCLNTPQNTCRLHKYVYMCRCAHCSANIIKMAKYYPAVSYLTTKIRYILWFGTEIREHNVMMYMYLYASYSESVQLNIKGGGVHMVCQHC